MRPAVREWFGECLATFVLITFGIAVVAQVNLGEKKHGDFLSINLGWGLAVMMGAYVGGTISGAHMNPAVTVALALLGKFSKRKVLPFILAQLVGAFLASALVFMTYDEALNKYDGGQRKVIGNLATAKIWVTEPKDYLSTTGGLVDQIVGTALLLFMVCALGDRRNLAPPPNLAPLFVGATVLLIGMTFGLNSGYAINPVRDFGPRLFLYVAGWGPEVFTCYNSWWWIPIVGPLIGGILGAFAYEWLIARQHPPEEKEATKWSHVTVATGHGGTGEIEQQLQPPNEREQSGEDHPPGSD